MKIREYLHQLLDLPTPSVNSQLIFKGIGYEVNYLEDLSVVKVKLFGVIDMKLINHIRDQIIHYSTIRRVKFILLDLNEPVDLVGKIFRLKISGLDKITVNYVVVLLPNWSEKRKHLRFLNFLGYKSVRFFFSYAGAINWIAYRNIHHGF